MERRTPKIPTSVMLSLTAACNLHCCHCSEAESRKIPRTEELTEQEWIFLLEQLRRAGVFSLNFSGGEIFVRPDAARIINVASRLRFLKIVVETNATLVDSKIAHALAEAKVSFVKTSIDGLEATHNRVRGNPDAFEKALLGIAELGRAGVATVVQFTAMRPTIDDLEATVKLVHELGVRNFNIQRVQGVGAAIRDYYRLALDDAQLWQLLDRIKIMRAKYSDMHVNYTVPFFQCIPTDGSQTCGSGGSMKLCSAGEGSCAVTSDGWVLPCSFFPQFRAGNVRQKTFLEVWQAESRFQEIRSLSRLDMSSVPECASCPHTKGCSGGCRAEAFALYGRLLSPDVSCPLWQRPLSTHGQEDDIPPGST